MSLYSNICISTVYIGPSSSVHDEVKLLEIDRNLNHNFDLAKRTYLLNSKTLFPCNKEVTEGKTLSEYLKAAGFSVEEQQGLARQTAGFFKSHYGVKFETFFFQNFSQEAFEKAKPIDLIVTEDFSDLFGTVTCAEQECFSNGRI